MLQTPYQMVPLEENKNQKPENIVILIEFIYIRKTQRMSSNRGFNESIFQNIFFYIF